VPWGHCPHKILPGPPVTPQTFSGLFLKVLHKPLRAPFVAKLAPPVAPQMKMSGSAPDLTSNQNVLIYITHIKKAIARLYFFILRSKTTEKLLQVRSFAEVRNFA